MSEAGDAGDAGDAAGDSGGTGRRGLGLGISAVSFNTGTLGAS